MTADKKAPARAAAYEVNHANVGTEDRAKEGKPKSDRRRSNDKREIKPSVPSEPSGCAPFAGLWEPINNFPASSVVANVLSNAPLHQLL